MKRYLAITVISGLLALSGSVAFAANDMNDTMPSSDVYASMDTNNDGIVSESEFKSYYQDAGIYSTWDANDDGWIDEDEFADGLYDYYDDDDNGYISDAEWEDGIMVDDYGEDGFWDL